jgi:GntR family transcriptional repressor for pyruvate dehydrogenase complex
MFEGHQKGRVSETQAQRILEMIESGKLKLGDKLPGERILASQLGISRSSVREAIRYLEAMGVVDTRVGLGTYVVNSKPIATIASSLSAWLSENRSEVIQVFEVRDPLESQAAALAAARADPEAIAKMEETLDRMADEIEKGNTEAITELDNRFHYLLGEATGNHLLHQVLESIQDLLMESRHAILSIPGRPERSLVEHREVLAAVRRSDPKAASDAMRRHLANAVKDVP